VTTETVRSADSTTIAFERTGAGPPLIPIGGTFNTRHSVRGLAALLAPHFTVYAYDRRGRATAATRRHTPSNASSRISTR